MPSLGFQELASGSVRYWVRIGVHRSPAGRIFSMENLVRSRDVLWTIGSMTPEIVRMEPAAGSKEVTPSQLADDFVVAPQNEEVILKATEIQCDFIQRFDR